MENTIQTAQEGTKQVSVQTIKNSIKPSIEEIERFILFLNNKFALNIKEDLVINIQETGRNAKGYFMPLDHYKHYQIDNNALNLICVSSLYLNSTPYETIAHELAHYLEHFEKKTKGNYHGLAFKRQAERLLLKVTKGQHGYNTTEETELFKQLLIEFIPNPNAFLIFQNTKPKSKQTSRNLLYECSCGIKIRSAKNEDKPLKAICSYCKSEFKELLIKVEVEND